jgi:hypothetical protein
LRQTLRQRTFWWLYAATVLAAPVMFVPFAHVSAAARDAGIDNAAAVGLVGLIGIGSLVGRFAIGALADRLGRGLTLVLMQVSMGASYLLCHRLHGLNELVEHAGKVRAKLVDRLCNRLHGLVKLRHRASEQVLPRTASKRIGSRTSAHGG